MAHRERPRSRPRGLAGRDEANGYIYGDTITVYKSTRTDQTAVSTHQRARVTKKTAVMTRENPLGAMAQSKTKDKKAH